MNADQFSQIAMIAQGDFLRLLLSKTPERSAIFREIFQTKIYQALQDRLKMESGRLGQQMEQLRKSLLQYVSGVSCGMDSDHADALTEAKEDEYFVRFDETMELIEKIGREDEGKLFSLEEQYGAVERRLEEINTLSGRAEERQRAEKTLKAAKTAVQQNQPLLADTLRL